MKRWRMIECVLCVCVLFGGAMTVSASSVPEGVQKDSVNTGDGHMDSQTTIGNDSVTSQVSVTGNDSSASQTSSTGNVKFTPKIIVKNCRISKDEIFAGDEIQVIIELENTSRKEILRNMTVTVSEPEAYLKLVSDTDTVYIDTVRAGGTIEVVQTYQVAKTAPEGQYILEVSTDYADSTGAAYTSSGKARLEVVQPVRVTFDTVTMEKTVQLADVLRLDIQAINLGRSKVYNVRAVLEGNGIQAENSAFIGDMEAGTTGNGTMNVTITGLSGGGTPYGMTEGTLTFSYEDESGNVYEETQKISTSIEAPALSEADTREDFSGQWWVIMAVLGALLTLSAAWIAVKFVKHRSA